MGTQQVSAELLEAAAGELEEVFVSLEELAGGLARLHDEASEAGRPLTRQDVLSLRPLVRAQVRRHDALVAGVGLLTRPRLLVDAPMFVEWWCAGAGDPFLLRVSLDPEHSIFSDYHTFEWFEEPWQRGAKRIAGPWVDYTGTGEHVVTLSVPVFGDGAEFLGVAGADVLVRQLEDLALPPLYSIAGDAALVNLDGRVIASNTPRLLAGSLLREADADWTVHVGSSWTVRDDGVGAIRHAQVPWAVVVYPRAQRPRGRP